MSISCIWLYLLLILDVSNAFTQKVTVKPFTVYTLKSNDNKRNTLICEQSQQISFLDKNIMTCETVPKNWL